MINLQAMDFKLNFTPKSPNQRFNYKQPMLLTGSCFADNISDLLKQHQFQVLAQPYGVVYNPISIAQQILALAEGKTFTENDLVNHHGLYHTWQHHSTFSNTDKNDLLQKINACMLVSKAFIHQPQTIVYVTFGSAFVYELKDTLGFVVANCHKYPQQNFNKRLLTVNEILGCWQEVMTALPHIQFVFTVSPVRHIKDGLFENNVSKGILLQAVYELCKLQNNAYYFPAYEVVVDELRDYRFYDTDLIHPTPQAIEYVWQQLVKTCFDELTQQFIADVNALNAMRNHRIMHQGTMTHDKFIEALKEKETRFISTYNTSK
jgi:hypothetical protein